MRRQIWGGVKLSAACTVVIMRYIGEYALGGSRLLGSRGKKRETESKGSRRKRQREACLFLPVRLLMLRSLSAFCLSTCRAAFCLCRAFCVLRRLKCRKLRGWLSGLLVRPSLCGAYSRSQRSAEHAGALGSASPIGDSGSLPFRAESDVHGCRTRARERCAVLRIVAASRLCWPLLSRNSRLCAWLRGAHSTADLRARV